MPYISLNWQNVSIHVEYMLRWPHLHSFSEKHTVKILHPLASIGPDLEPTRLQVGGSPMLPWWTSCLHTVPSSCLASTRRATEKWVLPCLPGIWVNPAKTLHDLKLDAICSFMGGVGVGVGWDGGWGSALFPTYREPVCEELVLMSDQGTQNPSL